MTKAYSSDRKFKIINAIENRIKVSEITKIFNIGKTTIYRLI